MWLSRIDHARLDEYEQAKCARVLATEQARCWLGVDGAWLYAYAEERAALDAYAAVEQVKLRVLADLPGATAGATVARHYVVETDVAPEFEDEFNDWYQREHLPGLARVPGTVRAQRFIVAAGAPRYMACYNLASESVFGSPDWLAVRATPWSDRVRAAFRNTRRMMFRPIVHPEAIA